MKVTLKRNLHELVKESFKTEIGTALEIMNVLPITRYRFGNDTKFKFRSIWAIQYCLETLLYWSFTFEKCAKRSKTSREFNELKCNAKIQITENCSCKIFKIYSN